jgi:hypothetical protein
VFATHDFNDCSIEAAYIRLGRAWAGIDIDDNHTEVDFISARRNFKLHYDSSMRHKENIYALLERNIDKKRFVIQIQNRHDYCLHLWYGTFLHAIPDFSSDDDDIRFYTRDVKQYDSLRVFIQTSEKLLQMSGKTSRQFELTQTRVVPEISVTDMRLHTKNFSTRSELCAELERLHAQLVLNPERLAKIIF